MAFFIICQTCFYPLTLVSTENVSQKFTPKLLSPLFKFLPAQRCVISGSHLYAIACVFSSLNELCNKLLVVGYKSRATYQLQDSEGIVLSSSLEVCFVSLYALLQQPPLSLAVIHHFRPLRLLLLSQSY